MEYQKIKGVKHCVYDHISEFYNDHPNETPLKNWREAKEGDWVWSDDGRIVQILKSSPIKHPNDRRNYKYCKSYIRTVVGSFLCLPKTYMDTDFSKHPNRYTFSGKNPKTVKERKGIKEKIFATNIAVGLGAVKSYMDAFSETNSYKAQKKAAILLNQERVMKEVEKSVLDIAKGMGLDHEYVLNKLKCLADSSSDDGIVLQSTKELAKIIGTSGSTIKSREMGIIGMFQGFSPEQLEKAERPKLKEVKGEEDDVP